MKSSNKPYKRLFRKPAGLFFIILLLVVTAIFGLQENKKEKQKPNVIIILSDDQGWGDLSVSGNRNISTPNIDRLADTGVTFDRFYVCPVCSPTRAELLTGRYHPRGGVYSTSAGGERLDPDETTIAEIFKYAGYATAAYGKWHNGMQAPYHPNARGFDDFYGFCSGHWGNYYSPMLEHNGEIVKGNGFIIDDLTDHGIQFIEKNKNNPFFLYLPYNTPHMPAQVPDRWWNKFKSKELEMRHRDPAKENVDKTRAVLAMCENIDWNVGRLIAKVDELDLSENTIVIYFSDNGPNGWRWNGGTKGNKGNVDEGGIRSPMFMTWKGALKGGMVIREITSVKDLLPTLTDLAGISYKPSKPLDGISLKPLLFDKNPSWKDRLIVNHWKNKTSVRSQKYLLDRENKLYDMENDPGQTKDMAGERPQIARELISAKEQWEKEVLAELPRKDARPFTLGHPDYRYTQLPARDGIAHGNIERSNRWPNCSYFTNWISTEDKISWDVEVLQIGNYEVDIYYTCPRGETGSTIELGFGEEKLIVMVNEPHDPPLKGMEKDRIPRGESYVKDFKPMHAGIIHLDEGRGKLTLKAVEIPGSQVMDFRMITFKKIKSNL